MIYLGLGGLRWQCGVGFLVVCCCPRTLIRGCFLCSLRCYSCASPIALGKSTGFYFSTYKIVLWIALGDEISIIPGIQQYVCNHTGLHGSWTTFLQRCTQVGYLAICVYKQNVSSFSKVHGNEVDLICDSILLQYYPLQCSGARCETAICSFSFGQSGLGSGWGLTLRNSDCLQ